MGKLTMSVAFALITVLATAASADRAGCARFPDAEEEEAAQMRVDLLQVGTSSQRGSLEDHQARLDEEEDVDEVEFAQVRMNVKRGLQKKVGISADGGVRTRGAGVAKTLASGRVAFRVAGDGSMTVDDDEDNEVLMSKVQLLQTKTQPVRVVQHRGTVSAETLMLQMAIDGEQELAAEDGDNYEADEWGADGTNEGWAEFIEEDAADDIEMDDDVSDVQLAEAWNTPDDINEDTARVAMAGVQRSVAEAATDKERGSPRNEKTGEADEDALAEEALVEVSEMTELRREKLYEALLEEEAPGSEQQDGSALFEVGGATAEPEDRFAALLHEDAPIDNGFDPLADEDGTADDAAALVFKEDGVVPMEDGSALVLEEDGAVEDGSALLFDEDGSVEDDSAFFAGVAIKRVQDENTAGEGVEGISLLQVVGVLVDDPAESAPAEYALDVAAEAETETLLVAEVAMLSTQLMQQDVVQFVHKPIAAPAEDAADDQSLLSGIIPASAGRSTVLIDQNGELGATEEDDDRGRSKNSGIVAMEVSSDGYAQWEE